MADAALTFLFDSGADLIKYFSNLLSGEGKNLSALKEDKKELKLLVSRANKEKDMEDKQCQDWVRDIRNTILDVEDTIETCSTTAEARKTNLLHKWFIGKKINEAEEVKRVKETVEQTLRSANQGFQNLPNAQISQLHGTHSEARMEQPREKNVIALEEDAEKLVKSILAPSKKLKMFSIVGMAGLGKTTLAWKISQNEFIKAEFPKIIWVKVSQDYYEKDVLLQILQKESERQVDTSTDVDVLLKMVSESLERGRFLIIFDDVWTLEDWKKIEKIFTEVNTCNEKGRALVTTRDRVVATYVCEEEQEPYTLGFLDNLESWQLLQLEVFGKLDNFPKYLEIIGKKIASKCKGLPLIVVVIGGILHDINKTHRETKERREEWVKVFTGMSEKINLHAKDRTEAASSIISLGYERLPCGLKDCFLYLGMFPEDADIPVWKLKQLWIAEGYIDNVGPNLKEEIAKTYVNDLVNKNLLMVTKRKPDGEIKACRVHDLIRGICITAANEKFMEIKWCKGEFNPTSERICKYRHVSLHSRVEDYFHPARKVDFTKVRSFLSFSEKSFTLKKEQVQSITDAFRVVRVLDINMAIPEFPHNLTQLVLLKYITLSSSEFKVLPKAIYRLSNVEILQVYTSSPTLKIKANIWRMKKLRHLKTKASIILVNKKRYSKLDKGDNNIQTLSRLSPQSCTIDVFNKAKNIKGLGICGDLKNLLGSKISILKKLEQLEKLKLVHEQLDSGTLDPKLLFGLPDQPTWFPKSLMTLVLSGTQLEWEHMSKLGEICSLKVLKLKKNAFKGLRWSTSDTGFGNLEALHILDADLKTWVISSSNAALPNLNQLVLKNCHKLNEIPDELVKRVELLYMDGVSKSVVSSAKKIHNFMIQILPAARNYSRKLVIRKVDNDTLRPAENFSSSN